MTNMAEGQVDHDYLDLRDDELSDDELSLRDTSEARAFKTHRVSSQPKEGTNEPEEGLNEGTESAETPSMSTILKMMAEQNHKIDHLMNLSPALGKRRQEGSEPADVPNRKKPCPTRGTFHTLSDLDEEIDNLGDETKEVQAPDNEDSEFYKELEVPLKNDEDVSKPIHPFIAEIANKSMNVDEKASQKVQS